MMKNVDVILETYFRNRLSLPFKSKMLTETNQRSRENKCYCWGVKSKVINSVWTISLKSCV